MDIKNITKEKITIDFSPDELAFLSNAINETLETLEEWEFQARTGQTRNRALEIHADLKDLLDKSKN